MKSETSAVATLEPTRSKPGPVPKPTSEVRSKLTVYAKPRDHATIRAFVAQLYSPTVPMD